MGNDGTVYQLSEKQVLEIEKKKIAGLLKIDLENMNCYEKKEFLMNFYGENCKRGCTKFS